MAIDVTYERKGNLLIGGLSGRLDTLNAEDLQRNLDAEIRPDDQALLLDFEHVSYISSSGLRVLLRMAQRFQQPGQTFAICALSEAVREILTVSGFDELFSIYDSQAAAISAIKNR